MKSLLKFNVILLIFALMNFVFLGQSSANDFIKTVLIYYVSKIKTNEIPKLANYDVLVLNRFNYDDIPDGTWRTIKRINPNIQIYVYQMGPEVADNQDNFPVISLNNISRFNKSRELPSDPLNIAHKDFFLYDKSGNKIRAPGYRNYVLLDFGSSEVQNYWIRATENDIIKQPWRADGIFVDGCQVHGGVFVPYNAAVPKYPGPISWNRAMGSFVAALGDALHKRGQMYFANRGNSRFKKGYSAWLELDGSLNVPDIILEEAAFAVRYGDDAVQFFPEHDWKRQVDLGYVIKNSHIAWLASTNLAVNGEGIDNWGRGVTFWQAFWYAMCSYHLAKNEDNMPYFMFKGHAKSYGKIWWFDEYEKIDLGKPLGNYKIKSVSSINIYWREFEKGYIFVNPTSKDAYNISLPESCAQLSHDTLNDDISELPQKSRFNLPAHHGTIFLKLTKKSASDSDTHSVVLMNPPSGLKLYPSK